MSAGVIAAEVAAPVGEATGESAAAPAGELVAGAASELFAGVLRESVAGTASSFADVCAEFVVC
jgi:hypothetical protein